jgi:hypothetical protein
MRTNEPRTTSELNTAVWAMAGKHFRILPASTIREVEALVREAYKRGRLDERNEVHPEKKFPGLFTHQCPECGVPPGQQCWDRASDRPCGLLVHKPRQKVPERQVVHEAIVPLEGGKS